MAANPASVMDSGLKSCESVRPRRRKKPGPKPGTHHAGTFKPGQYDPRRWTGGPYGTEVKRDFMEKVQDLSHDAVEVLREILEDPDAPIKERRAAAELVISHGYGTPVNRVAVAQINGTNGQAVASLDLPALRERANFLLENINSHGDNSTDDNVIDGEVLSHNLHKAND